MILKNELSVFLEENIYDEGGIYYDMFSDEAASEILDFIEKEIMYI